MRTLVVVVQDSPLAGGYWVEDPQQTLDVTLRISPVRRSMKVFRRLPLTCECTARTALVAKRSIPRLALSLERLYSRRS